MMTRGTCDCCDKPDVSVQRCFAYGIETFACAECSPEGEA